MEYVSGMGTPVIYAAISVDSHILNIGTTWIWGVGAGLVSTVYYVLCLITEFIPPPSPVVEAMVPVSYYAAAYPPTQILPESPWFLDGSALLLGSRWWCWAGST